MPRIWRRAFGCLHVARERQGRQVEVQKMQAAPAAFRGGVTQVETTRQVARTAGGRLIQLRRLDPAEGGAS